MSNTVPLTCLDATLKMLAILLIHKGQYLFSAMVEEIFAVVKRVWIGSKKLYCSAKLTHHMEREEKLIFSEDALVDRARLS